MRGRREIIQDFRTDPISPLELDKKGRRGRVLRFKKSKPIPAVVKTLERMLIILATASAVHYTGSGPTRFRRSGRGNMTEIAPRIAVDEKVRFGKPVIAGTHVPVDLVVGKLAGGMTAEQVMEEYELAREGVLAALSYAAHAIGPEQVH